MKRWFHEFVYGTEQDQICDDIEEQIRDQLNSRPTVNDHWPEDPTRRRVIKVLADAIKEEKEYTLEHVTLHPDDPIVLLLWGYYDDLTPLFFRVNLESAFDVRLPNEFWRELLLNGREDWHESERTVAFLVERCIESLPDEKRDTE